MAGESLLTVFTSAVGPPLSIAAAGYLLGRWRDVDVDPLSTVTIYLLMPALVFHSLVTMSVGGETVVSLVVVMVGFTAAMGVLAGAVLRTVGESGSVLSGAAMAAAFPNAGNFGIPVATFAFGAVGRTTAVLFVLVQNVLLYTVGVYALTRSGERGGRASALRRVLTLPVTHAVVVAGAVLVLDVVPPRGGTVMRTVEMVGNASIPLFLVILGVQLANMSPGTAVRRTLPTVGLKVLVAPVVALATVIAVGVGDDVAARTFVMLAAGPAAVTPLVLSVEFAGESEDESALSTADYVGSVVFLTVLASLPVVTGLVFLLRGGGVV